MTRNLVTREEVDAFARSIEDGINDDFVSIDQEIKELVKDFDGIDADIEEIDNILADLKARVDRLEQEDKLRDQVEDEITKIRRDQDELRFQLWLAIGAQFLAVVIILWLQT